MAQGCIHNKGESCHLLSEKGVSGEAIAGGGTVFHYCKSLKRVWAKEAFIEIKIVSGFVNVFQGKFFILRKKVCCNLNTLVAFQADLIWACNQ